MQRERNQLKMSHQLMTREKGHHYTREIGSLNTEMIIGERGEREKKILVDTRNLKSISIKTFKFSIN